MKKITIALSVCLLLFFSACKKEANPIDPSLVRCNDFESMECLTDNWAGEVDKVYIVEGSHDGSKCLFISTDSTNGVLSMHTFVEGLDSNKAYRITLYAKFKKVLPHLTQWNGHSITISMYPLGTNLGVYSQNNNSHDPVDQDWKKYTALFVAASSIPHALEISVSDMDSVWIDNIEITKF